jgi:hypothetical protein
VGLNWYQPTGIALVLRRWTFFFNFKGPAPWILQKMLCRHFEPKLLVMREGIGEALKMVCSDYQFSKIALALIRLACLILPGILLALYNVTN